NGNLIFDGTPPNPNITISDDDLIWIWDKTSNEARLLTRNGLLGPGAFLRMFHLPSYSPVRIGGNGQFVTFNSTSTGNQNVHGFGGTDAQMEILGVDISDPVNPGPVLRISIPDGFACNTTNNLASNSGFL